MNRSTAVVFCCLILAMVAGCTTSAGQAASSPKALDTAALASGLPPGSGMSTLPNTGSESAAGSGPAVDSSSDHGGSTVSPVVVPTQVEPVDPMDKDNAGRYAESVRLAAAMAPVTGKATADQCVDARTLVAPTVDDTNYEVAGRQHDMQAGFTACAFTDSQELKASVFQYADDETAKAAGAEILDQSGVVAIGKAQQYHESDVHGWVGTSSKPQLVWAALTAVQGRLVITVQAQNPEGGTGSGSGKGQADIAAAGLAAQRAALKNYQPTPTEQFAGVQPDPLLGKLIPQIGDLAQQQGSYVGVFPIATYQRFWKPAYLPAAALKAAKVDQVGLGGATVLRAADLAAAKTLRDALYQALLAAPFHPEKTTAPAGVVGAKCLASNGASQVFYCAVSVGRYTFVVDNIVGNDTEADRATVLDRPVIEQARRLAG